MCPPIFIQAWLQQFRGRTFFHPASCSLNNPICFRSMWCWRTLIPGKVFTGFAKCWGMVNINDFSFPRRLQELLQALLCFLRSFCFARIRLDPLGGRILHHVAYRWLFQDSQPSLRTLWSAVIKSPKFSSLGTTVLVRLPQEALVIVVLKQISQFRSFGKWVMMFCLLGTTFAGGSKGNSWEESKDSRCSGTLSSTSPSLNSCSQSGTPCNSPLCNSSSSFFFGFSISVDSILPAHKSYPRNNPGETFFPYWWILDWSFAGIGWYSTSEPNGIFGPSSGFPKRLS